MAQCKNQDGIPVFLEAIEGYIPGTPSGYHQFSQFMFNRPAYQWMAPQQFNCFRNKPHCLFGGGRVALDQEVGQPFEIGERSSRIDQPCQDLAFGFAGLLPDIRAVR